MILVLCLVLLLVIVSYEAFVAGPARRKDDVRRIFLNNLAEERKNLNPSIISNAMLQEDEESMLAMYQQSKNIPYVKHAKIEKFLNGKRDIDIKMALEISKSSIDYLDKLYILSYQKIDEYNAKEAAEDMNALLNFIELGTYFGFQANMRSVINPANLKTIEKWSQQKEHVHAYYTATEILKLLNSSLL